MKLRCFFYGHDAVIGVEQPNSVFLFVNLLGMRVTRTICKRCGK